MRAQKEEQNIISLTKKDNSTLYTRLYKGKKKTNSSFRVKLIFSFVFLIALTFGVGGTLLISTSFYSLLEKEKQTAIYEYETIQSNLMMLISLSDKGGDYNNMSLSLKQMKEQNIAHWQAISLASKGYVLYESGDQELLVMDFIEVNKNGVHTTVEFYDTKHYNVKNPEKYLYRHMMDENGRYLQMYSEISTGHETLYLKTAFDLSSAYELREQQQKLFFFIYIVVILLGFFVASMIAYLLTRRLQSLTQTVREISDGNFSIRTRLQTGDEFEQLSKDFDGMTDKLQENIQKLEDDVKRQEAFLGAVAHELKTPMTSIIGYADMIRQCVLDEEEQMMASNYIYTQGQRLEKLSHKILDLLLMEKDNFMMKEVELDVFLADIVNTLLPVARKKGITLHWECEPLKIQIEPDLGKSLMYNLIDNAMKATPSGGSICIRACARMVNEKMVQVYQGEFEREACRTKHDKFVCDSLSSFYETKEGKKQVNYRKKDDQLENREHEDYQLQGGCEIKVSDTGCGIEENEIRNLTEAFYRVDKSRSRMQGGVGLGLTLCKKIVDLHHGNMTFQSKVGKGSCVTVELYW